MLFSFAHVPFKACHLSMRLYITHIWSEVNERPSLDDVLEAGPAPPQDFNTRIVFACTGQEATQLGNPTYGLMKGGRNSRQARGAGDEGGQSLLLRRGQHRRTRGVWGQARLIGEPQEMPGHVGINRQ